MSQHQYFDEKAIQAMDVLLNHYWILRENDPKLYQSIREREKVLRKYISEKFGLRLIVHQHFIKLEKIPTEPESWMGIESFKEPMDYAIFCCALAYLEGKSVDEQFLLSELCEEIKADYPGDFPLDWTLYTHRTSLIRAMKTLQAFSLIKGIDGDIQRFDHNEEQEVLYEATVYSRYFMRSYPDDLSTYSDWEQLLQDNWKENLEDERRKRVYRKLFFSPGLIRKDEQDPDFLYLRNYRNRIAEDIEQHSDYTFHLYKNTAFLSLQEPKRHHRIYPDTKATSDLLLQLSRELHLQKERYAADQLGNIHLTETECLQLIEQMKEKYSLGWTKQFREMSVNQIKTELIATLKHWMMGTVDETTQMLTIHSLLGVLAGEYPKDFVEGVKENE